MYKFICANITKPRIATSCNKLNQTKKIRHQDCHQQASTSKNYVDENEDEVLERDNNGRETPSKSTNPFPLVLKLPSFRQTIQPAPKLQMKEIPRFYTGNFLIVASPTPSISKKYYHVYSINLSKRLYSTMNYNNRFVNDASRENYRREMEQLSSIQRKKCEFQFRPMNNSTKTSTSAAVSWIKRNKKKIYKTEITYPTHTVKHNLTLSKRYRIREGSVEKKVKELEDKFKHRKKLQTKIFKTKRITYPTLVEQVMKKGKFNTITVENKDPEKPPFQWQRSNELKIEVVKHVPEEEEGQEIDVLDGKEIEKQFQDLIKSHPQIEHASKEVKMKLKNKFMQLLISPAKKRPARPPNPENKEETEADEDVEKEYLNEGTEPAARDQGDKENITTHPQMSNARQVASAPADSRHPNTVCADDGNNFDVDKVCIKERATKIGSGLIYSQYAKEPPKPNYKKLTEEAQVVPKRVLKQKSAKCKVNKENSKPNYQLIEIEAEGLSKFIGKMKISKYKSGGNIKSEKKTDNNKIKSNNKVVESKHEDSRYFKEPQQIKLVPNENINNNDNQSPRIAYGQPKQKLENDNNWVHHPNDPAVMVADKLTKGVQKETTKIENGDPKLMDPEKLLAETSPYAPLSKGDKPPKPLIVDDKIKNQIEINEPNVDPLILMETLEEESKVDELNDKAKATEQKSIRRKLKKEQQKSRNHIKDKTSSLKIQTKYDKTEERLEEKVRIANAFKKKIEELEPVAGKEQIKAPKSKSVQEEKLEKEESTSLEETTKYDEINSIAEKLNKKKRPQPSQSFIVEQMTSKRKLKKNAAKIEENDMKLKQDKRVKKNLEELRWRKKPNGPDKTQMMKTQEDIKLETEEKDSNTYNKTKYVNQDADNVDDMPTYPEPLKEDTNDIQTKMAAPQTIRPIGNMQKKETKKLVVDNIKDLKSNDLIIKESSIDRGVFLKPGDEIVIVESKPRQISNPKSRENTIIDIEVLENALEQRSDMKWCDSEALQDTRSKIELIMQKIDDLEDMIKEQHIGKNAENMPRIPPPNYKPQIDKDKKNKNIKHDPRPKGHHDMILPPKKTSDTIQRELSDSEVCENEQVSENIAHANQLEAESDQPSLSTNPPSEKINKLPSLVDESIMKEYSMESNHSKDDVLLKDNGYFLNKINGPSVLVEPEGVAISSEEGILQEVDTKHQGKVEKYFEKKFGNKEDFSLPYSTVNVFNTIMETIPKNTKMDASLNEEVVAAKEPKHRTKIIYSETGVSANRKASSEKHDSKISKRQTSPSPNPIIGEILAQSASNNQVPVRKSPTNQVPAQNPSKTAPTNRHPAQNASTNQVLAANKASTDQNPIQKASTNQVLTENASRKERTIQNPARKASTNQVSAGNKSKAASTNPVPTRNSPKKASTNQNPKVFMSNYPNHSQKKTSASTIKGTISCPPVKGKSLVSIMQSYGHGRSGTRASSCPSKDRDNTKIGIGKIKTKYSSWSTQSFSSDKNQERTFPKEATLVNSKSIGSKEGISTGKPKVLINEQSRAVQNQLQTKTHSNAEASAQNKNSATSNKEQIIEHPKSEMHQAIKNRSLQILHDAKSKVDKGRKSELDFVGPKNLNPDHTKASSVEDGWVLGLKLLLAVNQDIASKIKPPEKNKLEQSKEEIIIVSLESNKLNESKKEETTNLDVNVLPESCDLKQNTRPIIILSEKNDNPCLADSNLCQASPIAVLNVTLPKLCVKPSLEGNKQVQQMKFPGQTSKMSKAGISTTSVTHTDDQSPPKPKNPIKNVTDATTPRRDDKDKKAIFGFKSNGEVFIIKRADEALIKKKVIKSTTSEPIVKAEDADLTFKMQKLAKPEVEMPKINEDSSYVTDGPNKDQQCLAFTKDIFKRSFSESKVKQDHLKMSLKDIVNADLKPKENSIDKTANDVHEEIMHLNRKYAAILRGIERKLAKKRRILEEKAQEIEQIKIIQKSSKENIAMFKEQFDKAQKDEETKKIRKSLKLVKTFEKPLVEVASLRNENTTMFEKQLEAGELEKNENIQETIKNKEIPKKPFVEVASSKKENTAIFEEQPEGGKIGQNENIQESIKNIEIPKEKFVGVTSSRKESTALSEQQPEGEEIGKHENIQESIKNIEIPEEQLVKTMPKVASMLRIKKVQNQFEYFVEPPAKDAYALKEELKNVVENSVHPRKSPLDDTILSTRPQTAQMNKTAKMLVERSHTEATKVRPSQAVRLGKNKQLAATSYAQSKILEKPANVKQFVQKSSLQALKPTESAKLKELVIITEKVLSKQALESEIEAWRMNFIKNKPASSVQMSQQPKKEELIDLHNTLEEDGTTIETVLKLYPLIKKSAAIASKEEVVRKIIKEDIKRSEDRSKLEEKTCRRAVKLRKDYVANLNSEAEELVRERKTLYRSAQRQQREAKPSQPSIGNASNKLQNEPPSNTDSTGKRSYHKASNISKDFNRLMSKKEYLEFKRLEAKEKNKIFYLEAGNKSVEAGNKSVEATTAATEMASYKNMYREKERQIKAKKSESVFAKTVPKAIIRGNSDGLIQKMKIRSAEAQMQKYKKAIQAEDNKTIKKEQELIHRKDKINYQEIKENMNRLRAKKHYGQKRAFNQTEMEIYKNNQNLVRAAKVQKTQSEKNQNQKHPAKVEPTLEIIYQKNKEIAEKLSKIEEKEKILNNTVKKIELELKLTRQPLETAEDKEIRESLEKVKSTLNEIDLSKSEVSFANLGLEIDKFVNEVINTKKEKIETSTNKSDSKLETKETPPMPKKSETDLYKKIEREVEAQKKAKSKVEPSELTTNALDFKIKNIPPLPKKSEANLNKKIEREVEAQKNPKSKVEPADMTTDALNFIIKSIPPVPKSEANLNKKLEREVEAQKTTKSKVEPPALTTYSLDFRVKNNPPLPKKSKASLNKNIEKEFEAHKITKSKVEPPELTTEASDFRINTNPPLPKKSEASLYKNIEKEVEAHKKTKSKVDPPELTTEALDFKIKNNNPLHKKSEANFNKKLEREVEVQNMTKFKVEPPKLATNASNFKIENNTSFPEKTEANLYKIIDREVKAQTKTKSTVEPPKLATGALDIKIKNNLPLPKKSEANSYKKIEKEVEAQTKTNSKVEPPELTTKASDFKIKNNPPIPKKSESNLHKQIEREVEAQKKTKSKVEPPELTTDALNFKITKMTKLVVEDMTLKKHADLKFLETAKVDNVSSKGLDQEKSYKRADHKEAKSDNMKSKSSVKSDTKPKVSEVSESTKNQKHHKLRQSTVDLLEKSDFKPALTNPNTKKEIEPKKADQQQKSASLSNMTKPKESNAAVTINMANKDGKGAKKPDIEKDKEEITPTFIFKRNPDKSPRRIEKTKPPPTNEAQKPLKKYGKKLVLPLQNLKEVNKELFKSYESTLDKPISDKIKVVPKEILDIEKKKKESADAFWDQMKHFNSNKYKHLRISYMTVKRRPKKEEKFFPSTAQKMEEGKLSEEEKNQIINFRFELLRRLNEEFQKQSTEQGVNNTPETSKAKDVNKIDKKTKKNMKPIGKTSFFSKIIKGKKTPRKNSDNDTDNDSPKGARPYSTDNNKKDECSGKTDVSKIISIESRVATDTSCASDDSKNKLIDSELMQKIEAFNILKAVPKAFEAASPKLEKERHKNLYYRTHSWTYFSLHEYLHDQRVFSIDAAEKEKKEKVDTDKKDQE